jgi:cation:H+ antiporter
VVGATAVALGTSLPELSVTVSSLMENVPDLSLGNIIGSNISNILLITGLCILIFPVRIGTTKTQKNNLINLLVTALFVSAFFLPNSLKNFVVFALFAAYLLFFVAEIIWGEKGGKEEDKKALTRLKKDKDNPFIIFIKITAAIALLLVSSHYTVSSSLAIAGFFKIKNEIIGLSLVALGTSFPELIASIASGFNKDYKLLIGDIQGSGIFNLSVLGATTLYSSKTLDFSTNIIPLTFMIFSTLTVYLLTRKYEGTSIPRYFGLLFLGAYSSYLFLIFI